jgi:hypothetical protein
VSTKSIFYRKREDEFSMPSTLPQNLEGLPQQDESFILTYAGEDDGSLFVSTPDGTVLRLSKNRSVAQSFADKQPQPLNSVFRLLALAFVGLAPAGLGALVLAPLATLWALAILITRHLSKGDRVRVRVVWGIAILLFGLAIPLCTSYWARLSP